MPTSSFLMGGSSTLHQPPNNAFENLGLSAHVNRNGHHHHLNPYSELNSSGTDFLNAQEFSNDVGASGGWPVPGPGGPACDNSRLASVLAQYACLNSGNSPGSSMINGGIMDEPQQHSYHSNSSSIWCNTGGLGGSLLGKQHAKCRLLDEDNAPNNLNPNNHQSEDAFAMVQNQFMMHQQHQLQNYGQIPLGTDPLICSGNLGTGQTTGAAPSLLKKKGFNMTECVPVPSSEHVAEIVGRQGCKIKALRAKTNTYIKTPVRGEEPVFVVTGRKEDVMAAKREIMSAAEHFSQIRASRKGSNGSSCNGGPLLPKGTCFMNNTGGGRILEMPPGNNNPFNNNAIPSLHAIPSVGPFGVSTNGQQHQQQPILPWNTMIPSSPSCMNESQTQSIPPAAAIAGRLEFNNGTSPASALLLNGLNQGNQCTVKVRVPYKVVGLVVGPKGATIKRIQQMTHTYIVTPSRDREPVFEITGTPANVESARLEIENHIAVRTAAAAAASGASHHQQLSFNTSNNELNAILPGPGCGEASDATSFNEMALLSNIMNLVSGGNNAAPNNSNNNNNNTSSLPNCYLDSCSIDYVVGNNNNNNHAIAPSNTTPSTLDLQRMLLQTLAAAAGNTNSQQHNQMGSALPLLQSHNLGVSTKKGGTHFAAGASEDDMTLLDFQARNRLGLNSANQQLAHGKRYNSDPMTTGLLPGLNESMANLNLFQRIMENVMNESGAMESTTADTALDLAIGLAVEDQCHDHRSALGRSDHVTFKNHLTSLHNSGQGFQVENGVGRFSHESLLSPTSPSSSPPISRAISRELHHNNGRSASLDNYNDAPLGAIKTSTHIPLTMSQMMEHNSVFVDNIMRVVGLATTSPSPNFTDITINNIDQRAILMENLSTLSCSDSSVSLQNTEAPCNKLPSPSSFWATNTSPPIAPATDNNNLNDANLKSCLVCKVGDRVAALVPCGHTLFCMDCATEAKSCPVCHRGATQAIRIYS